MNSIQQVVTPIRYIEHKLVRQERVSSQVAEKKFSQQTLLELLSRKDQLLEQLQIQKQYLLQRLQHRNRKYSKLKERFERVERNLVESQCRLVLGNNTRLHQSANKGQENLKQLKVQNNYLMEELSKLKVSLSRFQEIKVGSNNAFTQQLQKDKDLAVLSLQNQTLREQVERLQERLKDQQKGGIQRQRQVIQLQERVREKRECEKMLGMQLNSIREFANSIEREFQEKCQKSAQLQIQLYQQGKELVFKDSELSRLKTELNELNVLLRKKADEIRDDKVRLQSLQAQNQSLQVSNQSISEKMNSLQSQLNLLLKTRLEQKGFVESVQERERMLSRREEEMQKTQRIADSVTSRNLESLRREKEQLLNRVSQMQLRFDSKEKQVCDKQNQLGRVLKDFASKLQQKQNIQKKFHETELKLQIALNQLEDLRHLSKYKVPVQTNSDKDLSILNQIMVINQADSKASDLNQQLVNLKVEIGDLLAQNEQLKEQLTQLKTRVGQLQFENSTLGKQVSRLQVSQKKDLQRVQSLKRELISSESKLNQKELSIRKLQNQIQELLSRNQDLSLQNQTLKENLNFLASPPRQEVTKEDQQRQMDKLFQSLSVPVEQSIEASYQNIENVRSELNQYKDRYATVIEVKENLYNQLALQEQKNRALSAQLLQLKSHKELISHVRLNLKLLFDDLRKLTPSQQEAKQVLCSILSLN